MRVALFVIVASSAFGSVVRADPAHERVCFSAAETREQILKHGLAEPFRLMKSTAGRLQAEAIAVKLCRLSQDLVYEISLLRRDGHVIHVILNAANGENSPVHDQH